MKAHMTNGTWDFLEQIAVKHPQYTFYLMQSDTSTLAYYETHLPKKSVFKAGRSYDVLVKTGTLEEEGLFVFDYHPLTEEGRPIVENRFKRNPHIMEGVAGLIAFRFLRPLKGNTYVIFTQWQTETDYENWRASNRYDRLYAFKDVKPSAYFAAKPFVLYYAFFYPEEEEDEETEEVAEPDNETDQNDHD